MVGRKHFRFGPEEAIIRIPGLRSLYWSAAPKFYEKIYSYKEDTDRPVFEYRYIDPREVEYYSDLVSHYSGEWWFYNSVGSRESGDWDVGDLKEVFPFEWCSEVPDFGNVNAVNDLIYPAFNNRYQKGADWEETTLWKYAHERVKQGETIWRGCQSKKDIERKFSNMDFLFESLKGDYQTQVERSRGGIEHRSFLRSMKNEILVDIGRNGQVLFVNGIHRFSMVRVLDMESIPVVVVTRHERY